MSEKKQIWNKWMKLIKKLSECLQTIRIEALENEVKFGEYEAKQETNPEKKMPDIPVGEFISNDTLKQAAILLNSCILHTNDYVDHQLEKLENERTKD